MKKIILLISIFSFSICHIFAQSNKVYEVTDIMPKFPGGEDSLFKYIAVKLKYPKQAIEANLEGKVIVSFVIDETGNVQQVKVVKTKFKYPKKIKKQTINDDKESILNEATRVVKSMPTWSPGYQKGEKVKVHYSLPIIFELED